MAVLVGIQLENGEWDNFVLPRSPKDFCGSVDVLGRTLPCFQYLEAYEKVGKDDALRLARTLRGIPKALRRQAFLDRAGTLRLSAKGGTMI